MIALIDSATLVLVRSEPDLEVLLMERSAKSRFMGGAFVFPGGKLDPEDEDPNMRALVSQGVPAWCRSQLAESPGRPLSEDRAFGLFIAACRETFEEAGVLFAAPATGGRLQERTRSLALRRLQERGDDEGGFSAVLRTLNLRLDVKALHAWSHWITPSSEPRRYDTRFFVAHLPEGQTPVLDQKEAVSLRWLKPGDALATHAKKEIFLPPPTIRTIEEIDGFSTWADLEREARRRTPVPILPRLRFGEGTVEVVLPWDAAYAEIEGEGFVAGDNPRPDLPTRIPIRTKRRVTERTSKSATK